MKNLKDITLLALCCDNRVEGTINALKICMSYFDFGSVKYLSDSKPDNLPSDIKWEYIPKIENIHSYDVFAFENMYKHVSTSHALICQDHAYIIDASQWSDDWLQWDYLGAIWPIKPEYVSVSTGEQIRVGNGGFSLRSKRLLSLPSQLGLKTVYDRGFSCDDGLFCSYYRKTFLDHGIKYPDVHTAARFSFENLMGENVGVRSFGYHRYRNPTV
jgi:hypothetical protein